MVSGPGVALEGPDGGVPGAGRWQAARRIIPAGPPAQRLPGQPDQLIGRYRQSRRARPGSQHRLGERELSHFLAVAVDLELAPLAAGTNAEVVDLVGAAVVLEGGDGLAGAGGVFRGPQGQTFLALAHAALCGGGHRSVLSALAAATWSWLRSSSISSITAGTCCPARLAGRFASTSALHPAERVLTSSQRS